MTTTSRQRARASVPPGSGRTQAARRAEAEQRMLEAAARLVGDKGLGALTLAEVGKAAGYSRGLPTHYFGSRAGLLAALTDSVARACVSRVQARHAGRSSLDDLLAAVDYYLSDIAEDPTTWRAFLAIAGAALTDPDAAAALGRVNARAISGFESLIRAGVATGEIRGDVDPGAEAVLILATLRGMARLTLTDPDNPDLSRGRAALSAALRRNLESTKRHGQQ